MTRRVIAITGAGGALGAALSAHFAGEPDTDLVLSDVSAPSLDATVSGLPEDAGPVETAAGRRQRPRPGRSRRRPGGRALRSARRADQQRRRALPERPHPQPVDRGLGAGLPHQRPRCGQRHPGRGGGDAPAAVGLDRAHRVGLRAHRVVPRRALLRDQGGGDPARKGRRRRVRPRRDPGQLRVPGLVPLGHPRRPPRRGDRRRSPPGTRSGSAPPTTWSGPTPTSASEASRWTTGSAMVVDGGYSAP